MKRILFLITLVLVALTSCKKEESPLTQHNVMLRGQTTLTGAKSEGHLTPVQIAKQATNIVYKVKRWEWEVGKAGFDPGQRDTVNGVLLRWATDILKLDYTLDLDFVTGKDMVLERNRGPLSAPIIDTVGYIPNSVLENAYTLIMAAFEQEQWQEIYDIFNTEFVFIPITGPEYRALFSKGLN